MVTRMKISAQIIRTIIISILCFTVASCDGSSDNDSSNAPNFFTCLFTLLIVCRDAPDGSLIPASNIQEQIDAAKDGDTVVVAPGTYMGVIDFQGKAIKLVSEQGPFLTVIDGSGVDSPVISFKNGEGRDSILQGFTIQNGHDKGIFVHNASPGIINNIVANTAICDGAGIELNTSSAIVKQNTIRDNLATCTGTRAGGAIVVRGVAAAVIVNNHIIDNVSIDLAGGITLWDAGTPVVEGNTISGNSGGAIKIRNLSDALIVQNIISNNTGESCGGIDWQVQSGSIGPVALGTRNAGQYRRHPVR